MVWALLGGFFKITHASAYDTAILPAATYLTENIFPQKYIFRTCSAALFIIVPKQNLLKCL